MQQPRDFSQWPACAQGVPGGREKVRLPRTALPAHKGLHKERGGGVARPAL